MRGLHLAIAVLALATGLALAVRRARTADASDAANPPPSAARAR